MAINKINIKNKGKKNTGKIKGDKGFLENKPKIKLDEFIANNKKVGDLGENIAVVFLEKRGFNIIDRNYRNKIGELDIIAEKDGFNYIIEVKTLRINLNKKDKIGEDTSYFDNKRQDQEMGIIRDGDGTSWLKPEMNITDNKIRKIKLTALRYCMDFNIKEESLKFLGICISLYCSGSRVTKDNIESCKVKVLPIFS